MIGYARRMGNTLNDDLRTIAAFAKRHDLEADLDGSAGPFRALVGYTKNGRWLLYRPINMTSFQEIPGWDGDAIGQTAPANAYHKWDAVAVRVIDGEVNAAIAELAEWTRRLDALGVTTEQFDTRAVGMQRLVSGAKAWGIRLESGAA